MVDGWRLLELFLAGLVIAIVVRKLVAAADPASAGPHADALAPSGAMGQAAELLGG